MDITKINIINIIIVVIAYPILFYFSYVMGNTAWNAIIKIDEKGTPLFGQLVLLIMAIPWIGMSILFLIFPIYEFGIDGLIGMIIDFAIYYCFIKS
jgi:hypothetical protein